MLLGTQLENTVHNAIVWHIHYILYNMAVCGLFIVCTQTICDAISVPMCSGYLPISAYTEATTTDSELYVIRGMPNKPK